MRQLTPLVLLLLASCLDLEETITLRADGSGTQKLTVGLTEEAIGVLQRSANAATGTVVDPLGLFDEHKVRKELEGAGLDVLGFRTFAERQRRFAEIRAGFGGIAALRKSPLAGTQADWSFFAGPKPGTVRLLWYPQGIEAWRQARKKADELTRKNDDVTRRFFEKRKLAIAGLHVVVHLDLPGDVVSCSTNLTRDGARRVDATVVAADIKTPQDLVLQLAPRYEIVFEGHGCSFALEQEDHAAAPGR